MIWHAVDSQSTTHVQPIYHGGLMLLLEVPNAPDWEYTRAVDTRIRKTKSPRFAK